MPQMNPGGKFIFGLSLVREGFIIQLPPQAIQEYGICQEGRVYLFTGSRSTGGFCITRKGLLGPSQLGHILTESPALENYTLPEGRFLRYKGRSYCWVSLTAQGRLCLPVGAAQGFSLSVGQKLLSIRSSDIAFTMGAKGPLLAKAAAYPGEIPLF